MSEPILVSGILIFCAYVIRTIRKQHYFRKGFLHGYNQGLNQANMARTELQRGLDRDTVGATLYINCEADIPHKYNK